PPGESDQESIRSTGRRLLRKRSVGEPGDVGGPWRNRDRGRIVGPRRAELSGPAVLAAGVVRADERVDAPDEVFPGSVPSVEPTTQTPPGPTAIPWASSL